MSTCTTVCGDKVKAGTEECDNANRYGCIDCKVEKGYTCSGEKGEESQCRGHCGDKYKTADEQCDNGELTGCSKCKVVTGYKCSQLADGSSKCVKK